MYEVGLVSYTNVICSYKWTRNISTLDEAKDLGRKHGEAGYVVYCEGVEVYSDIWGYLAPVSHAKYQKRRMDTGSVNF